MTIMGVDLKPKEIILTALVGAGAVAAVSYLARQGVKEVAHAVNPTDPENVFNRALNATGAAVTGRQGWTLGGALYDWTHDSNNKPNLAGDLLDTLAGVN